MLGQAKWHAKTKRRIIGDLNMEEKISQLSDTETVAGKPNLKADAACMQVLYL